MNTPLTAKEKKAVKAAKRNADRQADNAAARGETVDPAQATRDAIRAARHAREADYVLSKAAADPSIIIRQDHRGCVVHAKRGGVFGLMLSRKGITQTQFDTVDRLYQDLAIARHEADRGPPVVSGDGSSAWGPLDRALNAQWRCGRIQDLMPQRFWIVLRDLIANEIGGAPQPWRDIVRMATAEDNEECQAMAVRWACAELVAAYREIDNSDPLPMPQAKLAGGV